MEVSSEEGKKTKQNKPQQLGLSSSYLSTEATRESQSMDQARQLQTVS